MTDQLGMGRIERDPETLPEQVGECARLRLGLGARDDERAAYLVAVEIGRADLERAGRRAAFHTPHTHAVAPELFEPDGREVGDHVGRDVAARIAHLVDQLLLDRAHRDRAAGAGMLGDHEGAVGRDLDHRVADALEMPDAPPVREIPAGALGAALHDVAGDDAGREPVPVVGLPAERVDHGCERDAGVGAAAGDHDLRAGRQRLHHRPRAVVGVGGRDPVADRGERRAAVHVVERHAGRVQLAEPLHEVVPDHRRDLDRVAAVLRGLEQGAAAGEGIHAAGVGDGAGAALDQQRQGLGDLGDEIAREARTRVAGALLLHDRHRDLGEEVERHVVDRSQLELAAELGKIVAPVTTGVGDADQVGHEEPHAKAKKGVEWNSG